MEQHQNIDLEVIATSLTDVLQINQTKATRIELCGSMECDGLTPGLSLIMPAIEQSVKPVRVMIRPRPGNFVYSREEFQNILATIHFVRCCGAEGIVMGMLTKGGRVDSRMEEVMMAVGTMRVTFHRAFEQVKSPMESYNYLCEMGVDSILSTYHPTILELPTAPIDIRLGGGISREIVEEFVIDGRHRFHMGKGVRYGMNYDGCIDRALIDKLCERVIL